jgi:hypothetical protein
MTSTKEQRHDNGVGKADPLMATTPEQQRNEIRRLREQSRALKEMRRLQQSGQTVPKPLLQQAIGRIEFKSAAAKRER